MPEPPKNSTQSSPSDPRPLSDAGDASPSFFIGPKGLRAGWRLAIYGAAYYLLRNLAGLVVAVLTGYRQSFSLWTFLGSESLLLVAAVVPAFGLAQLEQRPLGDYGLPFRNAFGRQFWSGILWGLGAITCLLLAMRAVGVFHIEGIVLHGFRALKFAAFWSVMFLVVAFYEDFLFRGYSQFTLAQGIGFWPSALLLSIVFGTVHLENPGETWTGVVGVVCIGLFFCFTLRRTGNLWFAIGMHAAWDWGETFLYSVPDSGIVAPGHFMKSTVAGPEWLAGGSVGPEGSLLLFGLIALMWILFDRIYPAKRASQNAPLDRSSTLQSRTSG